MKYQVPLYKIKKNSIKQVERIVVDRTSLGVYDMVSGKKIRTTSGLVALIGIIKPNEPFVNIMDFNANNLIAYQNMIHGIDKNKINYNSQCVRGHAKRKII